MRKLERCHALCMHGMTSQKFKPNLAGYGEVIIINDISGNNVKLCEHVYMACIHGMCKNATRYNKETTIYSSGI